MKELVQNILVYVVIVSALKGLITNPKYSQYFQFFSGIILILLLLSPILNLLEYESRWYDILEEKVLQMDLDEIKEEMKIADEKFAGMVEEEYKQALLGQVEDMAEGHGVGIKEANVELAWSGGEWEIEEVSVMTKEGPQAGQQDERISIEAVIIGENNKIRQEDTSKNAKALRKDICSSFIVGKDKVHIWK